jgi:hypothetical protein
MIPDEQQAKALWEKYRLPDHKRVHVTLVAQVAMFFAKKIPVDERLLLAAALLHDIDKAVPRLPGERHPDTAVLTHSLHTILNPATTPATWEQKLLYLADKMVKYDIVGVDARFALWNAEHLPPEEQAILNASYPKVKKLEQEVFNLAQLSPGDILKKKEGIV